MPNNEYRVLTEEARQQCANEPDACEQARILNGGKSVTGRVIGKPIPKGGIRRTIDARAIGARMRAAYHEEPRK